MTFLNLLSFQRKDEKYVSFVIDTRLKNRIFYIMLLSVGKITLASCYLHKAIILYCQDCNKGLKVYRQTKIKENLS